jgi:hypothetical protein
MKPNPEPIINAVAALGLQPGTCVLIGDSLSDITAAQAAGVSVIAYANKPSKKEQFAEAGADTVVTSMVDVVGALRSGGPNPALRDGNLPRARGGSPPGAAPPPVGCPRSRRHAVPSPTRCR